MAARGMLQVLQKYNSPSQSYKALYGPGRKISQEQNITMSKGVGFS